MENTTLPLNQIIKNKIDIQKELKDLKEHFEEKEKILKGKYSNMERLERLALENNDINKIQIAESVIYCTGNVSEIVDGKSLIQRAIQDFANDCKELKQRYFGNKRYSGYYQNSNHTYYMGPSHGSIVDELGLKKSVRDRKLSDEEKDACIYYLSNYSKIKSTSK